MKPPQKNYDIARALSAAFEPLIDVCLELGVTSPELETLLRSAFVHRTFDKLPADAKTGRLPTANKVSVATGLHRNEVGKIRSGGAEGTRETMQLKERLYSKSARLLQGWTTDPKFLASSGRPLDLPMERNKQRRSFEDLVDKYAPGNFPATVLKELTRRGHVEVSEDNIVRFKTANAQTKGVTSASIAEAAERMNRLGMTLFRNILDPDQERLYQETGKMTLTKRQLAMLKPILELRAQNFLNSINSEISARGVKDTDDLTTFGVGVFSWE